MIGQRLVRLICPACKSVKKADSLPGRLNITSATKPYRLAEGKGCPECLGTGFKGRSGIFEILTVGDPLHYLIMKRASAGTIEQSARQAGMKTLLEDGCKKILAQETTAEEVMRII